MATPSARRRPPKTPLAAILALAVWGAVPPWVGPLVGLDVPGVPSHIEVMTHAVPAVIAAGVAIAGLTGRLPLAAALLLVLAGLWETATHVPLVGQAVQGLVGFDAALFHSVPGFAILALAVVVAVWAWRAEAHAERAASGRVSQ